MSNATTERPEAGPDAGAETDESGDADGTSEATAERRHDRIERHGSPGPRSSLWHWTRARNPLRLALQAVLVTILRRVPSLRVKNALLSGLGAEVGEGVGLAYKATPDLFWPDLITIEDDAIVGYEATILCHEFLQDETRTGEVVIGERAMVGAGAIVLPGVEIGADAQVAANSLVAEDVPPDTTVAGVPATPIDE